MGDGCAEASGAQALARLPFSKAIDAPLPQMPKPWRPSRGDMLKLPSGRVVTVTALIYGGRATCTNEGGDSVSLTLAFLRKHGVPA